MDTETFWAIVADAHAPCLDEQEKKLFDRLMRLTEDELLDFARHEAQFCIYADTEELRGLDYIRTGYISDDGFHYFLCWLIHRGHDVFQRALTDPDSLVGIIDADPDAGCEGIGYVVFQVLKKKNPRWGEWSPNFEFDRPPKSQPKWRSLADLRELLPKSFDRYIVNATEEERSWRNLSPEDLKQMGVRVGEPQEFSVQVEHGDISGQPATRFSFTPVDQPKTPTWSLLRQDDNGNRFVVRQGLSQDEAARLMAEFEARGHKQVYWIEPDQPF